MDIIYIYGLYDPRNNELRYIGKSNNPKRRLSGHIVESKRNREWYSHKENWIRQLLSENLLPYYQILEITDEVGWVEKEKFWITFYNNGNLTNIKDGGQGGQGFRHTDEAKQKISLFHKGKPKSDEAKLNMSKARLGKKLSEEHKKKLKGRTGTKNGFYGKHHTEELKQYYKDLFTGQKIPRERVERMAQSLKGRVKSEDEIRKLSEAHKGKKFSEEHRKHLSEARKGKKLSQETIEKIIKTKTGKKQTEETKLKISKANFGRKRSNEFRQRISLIKTGTKLSEETKNKIREKRKGKRPHLGHKHSDETKAKIGLSTRKRYLGEKLEE